MSVDQILRTRLHRLVQPVEHPGAVVAEIERRLGRSNRRRRRRRTRGALAASAAVLLGAGATLLSTLDEARDEVRAGLGSDILALPAVGEVRGEELADGTPVWVVRHENGTVSVLDAVSAHRPFGAGEIVGWCEPSRRFEDPQYGSVYDERGLKVAGPAPAGMELYPASVRGDDAVAVLGRSAQQPVDGVSPGAGRAPSCSGPGPRQSARGTRAREPATPSGDQSGTGALADAVDGADGVLVAVSDAVLAVSRDGTVACTAPPTTTTARPSRAATA